jgi:hypothetical protein
MIQSLMSGVCLTADEQAIIRVLDASSEKGDLEAVLAGLDRSALMKKIDDDSSSKVALKRYLTPPKDALGVKPGRFSVTCSTTRVSVLDASQGACKLDNGGVWLQSKAYQKFLRDMKFKPPGAEAHLAQMEASKGWVELHKEPKAVAVEQNNESAYTVFFNSEEVARAAETRATNTGLVKARLNSF